MSSTFPTPKGYRPDIDGLRAIAVTSVVIHHVDSSLLPGGFIGVDIFFVISGFLITSQIYNEIKAGTFSVKRFYKRRINRIVPALSLMVFVCAIVGAIILSPTDLKRLALSSFLSLVGFSNFFFWREYGNYFAADSAEAILLHTWTLGVEEQFYFVWPLLLLLVYSFAARRLGLVLAVFGIVAIGISQYGTAVYSKAAYYLLPTRFFELMIGSLLAVVAAERKSVHDFWSPWYLLLGYGLVFLSLFWLNKESAFPGFNALLPCLGSAALIWAGTNGRPTPLLANRPMVFIGLISYSLYLWHWPLIAYVNYLGIPMGFSVGLAVVGLAVILAWTSWKYVEVPFRTSGVPLLFSRVLLRRLIVPVTIFSAFAAACQYSNGFPQRFDSMVSSFEAMAALKPNESRKGCHASISEYQIDISSDCRLGVAKPEVDGILLGDSYANHFTGMVDVLAHAAGITISDYTMDGCPPVLGYESSMRESYVERCAWRNRHVYSLLEKRHYRYVILAADWPYDEAALEPLDDSIARIVASGARPVVVLGNQQIAKAASCPIKQLMFRPERTCSVPQSSPPSYWEKVRSRFPEVRFVDPNHVICEKGACSPVNSGILLYRDDGHLNDAGSRLVGERLRERGVTLNAERAATAAPLLQSR